MTPEEALARLGDVARRLPKPVLPPSPAALPPGMLRCACQKKLIGVDELTPCVSPVLGSVLDDICRDCRKDTQKMALLVCVGCRQVVSRLAPHRDASGFTFEPGGIYHVTACPVCRPALKMGEPSCLVEKELYDRVRRGVKH